MTHWVTLKPSGHRFEVPDGMSILQAGLNAGFSLPYSCRQGVCSSCRGAVRDGVLDFGEVHPAYLSEADRAKGFAHLCQAKPLGDLTIEIRELEGLAGIRVRTVPCRVSKIEHPAPDVTILGLRLPLNENMLFLAGQHIEFLLPDERRRSYSIASKASAEGVIALELHIRHTTGGYFTQEILAGLKERALMRFEGPLGSFHLRDDSDKPVIFVAAGTGFSPIQSICSTALERGVNQRRPMTLYWGGRTRQDLYRLELAQGWARDHANFTFIPVLSEPTPACAWSGRTGLVHEAVMADFEGLDAVQVYVCGAPVMVEAARRDFIEKRGLPAHGFFADSFLTAADRAAP